MKRYICLRDDDTYYKTKVDDLTNGFGGFWGKLPITLGVVPFSHGSQSKMYEFDAKGITSGKYLALREWELKTTAQELTDYHAVHPIGENSELVSELKNQIKSGLLEVAQHGVFHKYNEYGPETRVSQVLLTSIRDGQEYLSKLFDQDIKTYIPPSNTVDQECAKFIHSLGMDILTSGGISYNNKLIKVFEYLKDHNFINSYKKYLKYKVIRNLGGANILFSITFNSFDDIDDVYERVKLSLDNTGFASLTSHYMLFNNLVNNGMYAGYNDKYETLIKKIQNVKNVEFVRASTYGKLLKENYNY